MANNPEKAIPPRPRVGHDRLDRRGLRSRLCHKVTRSRSSNADAATETARNSAPYFFYVAGGSGILLGLFSFFLPDTPAPLKGKPADIGAILGRDAFGRFSKTLRLPSFLAANAHLQIPLSAYYAFAATYVGAVGYAAVPIKMTFGQMSEIFFMLVMPLFFARLGVKWMLAVGMLAWVIRYGMFGAAWGEAGANPDLKWLVLGWHHPPRHLLRLLLRHRPDLR